MKKKLIISISLSVVALVLVAALLVVIFAGSGLKIHDPIDASVYASSSDESWQKVGEGEIVLENDGYKFVLDAATTHFTVTDKKNGNSFNSVSTEIPEELTDNEAAPLRSELILGYFDRGTEASTVITYLNSSKNSVGYHFSEVKTDGNAIRVYYTMRQNEFKSFAPNAIPQDIFEEKVLANLQQSHQSQLKMFYKLYYSDYSDVEHASQDEIDAADKLKDDYPALEEMNLYILKDTVNANDLNTITKRMNAAGYTEEQYLADAEAAGIDVSESSMTVGFVIPVEYKLNDSGFSAEILGDKIVIESQSFVLSEIDFLPYFGATGFLPEASFLVPDGCGGIIEHKGNSGAGFVKQLYGTDESIIADRTAQLAQNGVLPVFGYDMGNKGFFTVIDSGAELATVYASIFGGSNYATNIYSSFTYSPFDTSSLGVAMGKTQINLYPKSFVNTHAKLSFYLLGEENHDYNGMADIYREHLLKAGLLGERLTETENVPLYLDFTGYFTTIDSVIGISYTKNNVISTLSNVTSSVEKLKELGANGINVRLKAYGNGGLNPSINDSFDLIKKVGSVKELLALRDILNKTGGILYLEDNVAKVSKNSLLDGFDRQRHATRTLADLASTNGTYNIISRKPDHIYYPYYSISPMYFGSMVDAFCTDFTEKVGTADGFGYSWSDYGKKLWSDFHDSRFCNRESCRILADEAVGKAKETFAKSVTDFGNVYSLGQNETILNIPTSGSLYDIVTYDVPFYEMVIHGYKDYAGAPFNLAADPVKNYLSSVECGANVYYSCYTEDNEIIKRIYDRSVQYPTGIEGIHDEIAEKYTEFNGVFKELRTQLITKHERLDDQVFCTTYEKGTKVVVNYSGYDYTLSDGTTVSASGYAVIK